LRNALLANTFGAPDADRSFDTPSISPGYWQVSASRTGHRRLHVVLRRGVKRQASAIRKHSVPTMTMALTNLVGVECATSCAGPGAYERALLSANEAADARACQTSSGHR